MSDKGAALDKETEGLSPEEILAYEKEVKEALYKVHSDAIPMSEMRYFIDEMSLESKRYFISENLKSVPLNKAVKMSGKQLTLLLKTRSKSTKDQSHLKGVLLFILKEIYMNYHLDEKDDSLLEKEIEIREQYGDWHYYFALQLAPFTNSDIKARKEALLDELLEHDAGSINSKKVEIVSVVPHTEETSSKEKEILQQERKLRIEIQEKNDKLQAQVKQLEQLYAAVLEKQKEDSSILETLSQRLQDAEVQKQEIHLALQESCVSLQKSTKQCVSYLKKISSSWMHRTTKRMSLSQ